MERNITLDYFKLVLRVMILIQHIPYFDYSLHTDLSFKYIISSFYDNGIERVAVPCYFILNGFFFKISNPQKLKKYLSHILLIYIVWQMFYLPFYYRDGLSSFILNQIFGYEHLWYVSALMGAVILLYFYNKFLPDKNKLLMIISCILFIIPCLIEFFGISIPSFLYRNFLFFGFPFVAMGYLLKIGYLQKSLKKHLNTYLILGIIVLLIEAAIRNLILFNGGSFLFSLLFVCPCLFIFIEMRSKTAISDDFISYMSAAIYFIHCAIIKVILPLTGVPRISLIPTIVILSFLAGYIIVSLNKRIKIFL